MDAQSGSSPGPITLDREIYLVALHPPGNIERIAADLQRSLFRRFALRPALGPLVPLAFSRARPEPPRAVRAPRCATSGWAWESAAGFEGRALYLGLEEAGGAAVGWPAAPAEPLDRELTPFPIARGLLVAFDPGGAGSGEQPLELEELGAPPTLAWGVSSLVCTLLRWSGASPWYRFCETVEQWSVRLGRSAMRPDSSSR